MISKQLLLGGILLFGGGISLFALNQKNDAPQAVINEQPPATPQDDVARPKKGPLTADIETERRLLEQKRREREALAQEQERQTQALLAEQEKAKAEALRKAQTELEAKKQPQQADDVVDSAVPATTLKVETRPEIIKAQEEAKKAEAKKEAEKKTEQAQTKTEQAKKAEQANEQAKKDIKADKKEPVKAETKKAPKGQHTVQQGDTLIKLSHQYGIPVSVLASANGIGRNDTLTVGKNIKIPSKDEAQKIAKANDTKKADDKTKTDTKAKTDTKKSNKVPTHYSVQVGLVSKDKADALAKQYRQAGYKVQTSQTSRGVRILVGSTKTEAEANALKNKIIKDSRVKTDGAWVKQVDEINAP